jgi:hypothetical protein
LPNGAHLVNMTNYSVERSLVLGNIIISLNL